MKLVEAAIYAAKIPQVTPQRHDARTIKIPIPKYVVPPVLRPSVHAR
jgi:ribosome recycling factor